VSVVRFHQLEQAETDFFKVAGQGDVKSCGIAGEARPMPLKGKQDALLNPQRGENSPTREQAHLPRRQHRFGSAPNRVVVQNISMKHETILSRGGFVN
jgi:hypothetical protein